MKTLVLAAASAALLAFSSLRDPASGPRPVAHLSAAEVAAAFAQGRPLVEVENYKVHASRRDAAGQAEVHTRDTDIIYVLTGMVTFVTGGTLVGAQEIAPEEIRGLRVDGGQARILKAGEIVIVPAGTPHWFKEVPAPMTYYVVKVRAEAAR